MCQDNPGKIRENIDFLQSEEWRIFQEATGKRTFHVENGGFSANVIEHKLPFVGKYFYIPRWPSSIISNFQFLIFDEVFDLAKKEKIGWIRIEPENEKILGLIKKNLGYEIKKAPHDMQPKEIFMIDITKSEEEILTEMKPKTRYNINLARKRGVSVKIVSENEIDEYIEKFIEIVNLTAKRKNIKFHPGDYYRKMVETIPGNILKLYIAEYKNKIIAANLVVFYEKIATYLHGATDDEYRNAMAPYLLQWQSILDAQKTGCEKYDFGGARVTNGEKKSENNDWSGITRFKLGFSPKTETTKFPGSYDIVINRRKYYFYVIISRLRRRGG